MSRTIDGQVIFLTTGSDILNRLFVVFMIYFLFLAFDE